MSVHAYKPAKQVQDKGVSTLATRNGNSGYSCLTLDLKEMHPHTTTNLLISRRISIKHLFY